jgi:hypothetical protein
LELAKAKADTHGRQARNQPEAGKKAQICGHPDEQSIGRILDQAPFGRFQKQTSK